LSAKHESGDALSMEASREFSRTPRRLSPCSDVSVLQKTRMSHFWDTHHTPRAPNLQGAIRALVNSFRIDQYKTYLASIRNAAFSGLLRIEHCKTGHLGEGVLFDHALQQCCRGYGACPKNETCAFSEGLTHHCTGAGGVGYEKILDWPPWKEPLPTRAWLTTP